MPVPAHVLYDRHAAEFEVDTTLDALPESFTALLESFVDDLDGPVVLDAGCGPGRDAAFFSDRALDPIGIDLADGMLERARAHRPGRYLKMDVRTLAFEAGAFDGVWCPATLCFVPADGMAAALDEFHRVLHPGGTARIGFKLGAGPVEVEKWGETTREYHVSRATARALLAGAGFRVESATVDEISPARTFANFHCRPAGAAG